jgi:cytochrome c peroxidase
LGAFKTPALRDVAARAPYMHDGSVPTLREAVDWHVRGGRPNPRLDPLLVPITLTDADVTALVTFLESLTSLQAPDPGPATFPR